jgi:Putative MetA-pathway of phenol degradation
MKPTASDEAKRGLVHAGVALTVFTTALLFAAPSAWADPPGMDQSQDPTGGQDSGEESNRTNNGHDITRPQNAIEMRFPDQGSSNNTSETNEAEMLLRITSKIPLDAGWRLGLLAEARLVEETTTNFEPPSVNHEFGLGDAVFQTFVAHNLDERWAIGVGARLVAPAASDDLGSGKWQIMPGIGVRYSLPEWGADSYFVPVVRYAISVAGDPSRRRISEPQIAPTLNIDLPGPWFMTFYPSNDIRINFGQPKSGQTGRLFLPFDALIGAKLTNTLEISLEGSVPIVKEYPVYNFKTELRIRMLF